MLVEQLLQGNKEKLGKQEKNDNVKSDIFDDKELKSARRLKELQKPRNTHEGLESLLKDKDRARKIRLPTIPKASASTLQN